MDIYQDHGYESRRDYLESLAEDCGLPVDHVFALADLLGPDEDFDGLVTSLEDFRRTGSWQSQSSRRLVLVW